MSHRACLINKLNTVAETLININSNIDKLKVNLMEIFLYASSKGVKKLALNLAIHSNCYQVGHFGWWLKMKGVKDVYKIFLNEKFKTNFKMYQIISQMILKK